MRNKSAGNGRSLIRTSNAEIGARWQRPLHRTTRGGRAKFSVVQVHRFTLSGKIFRVKPADAKGLCTPLAEINIFRGLRESNGKSYWHRKKHHFWHDTYHHKVCCYIRLFIQRNKDAMWVTDAVKVIASGIMLITSGISWPLQRRSDHFH